jgi:protein SCO1
MNRNIRITVIVALLFVALVFFLTWLRVSRNNAPVVLTPQELREVGALVYERPVELTAFNLQDHYGRPYDMTSLQGQWSLLFFGFTSCPDVCPLTLHELKRFYEDEQNQTYRADTRVVMVSVDPSRDTQEKLAEYMAVFHPDFLGVGGDYAEISQLARQLFVAHSEPPAAQAGGHGAHGDHGSNAADYMIDHSANILIINPQGRYHGFMEASIKAGNISRAYQAVRSTYRP